MSEAGDLIWQKKFGGSQADYGFDIIEKNYGYTILGHTKSSDGDVLSNHGGEDIWIFEIDFDGNILWQNSLGGSYDDRPSSFVQTADNGYIIGGRTASNDGDITNHMGLRDAWVIKLDSTGVVEWEKTFGGSSYDEVYDILKLSENRFLLTGISISDDGNLPPSSLPGVYGAWILEMDKTGIVSFEYNLAEFEGLYARQIYKTSDNSIFLGGTGITITNDSIINSNNCWLIKLVNTATSLFDTKIDNSSGFALYPNPVDNELYINYNKGLNHSNLEWDIVIYNTIGKKIRTYKHLSIPTMLKTNDLPCGTYFVQFSNGLNILNHKIIKGK